jgi:hypothetical protein
MSQEIRYMGQGIRYMGQEIWLQVYRVYSIARVWSIWYEI